MKNTGLCWCMHHMILLEWCYDYKRRVKFIKENKPRTEVPTRLYEMQFVKGKLPEEIVRLAKAFDKALEAYDKALEAYDKASEAFSKVREAFGKAREAFGKAREAYDKACKPCDKAQKALNNALIKHETQLEKLHREQVPDTCWNGERLVFPKESK